MKQHPSQKVNEGEHTLSWGMQTGDTISLFMYAFRENKVGELFEVWVEVFNLHKHFLYIRTYGV